MSAARKSYATGSRPRYRPWSVVNLDRQSRGRPVQHGLTVEPGDCDLDAIEALLLEQAFDRLRVRLGDQLFGFGEDPGARLSVAERTASASACRSRTRSGPE
jgi:hypothetical protein